MIKKVPSIIIIDPTICNLYNIMVIKRQNFYDVKTIVLGMKCGVNKQDVLQKFKIKDKN